MSTDEKDGRLSGNQQDGTCGRDGCFPGWPCVECSPVPNGLGTPGQRAVLAEAARLARHDLAFVPTPALEEAAAACKRAGWFAEVSCVVADGDGCAMEPETWVTGYDLTDAGRAALARSSSDTKSAGRP